MALGKLLDESAQGAVVIHGDDPALRPRERETDGGTVCSRGRTNLPKDRVWFILLPAQLGIMRRNDRRARVSEKRRILRLYGTHDHKKIFRRILRRLRQRTKSPVK